MRQLLFALLACPLLLGAIQPKPVEIDKLKVGVELNDRSPMGMITFAADHHGCTEWPYTVLKPLADAYRVPVTPYIQRDPDIACSGASELTNARLQELAQDPYFELGSHSARHFLGASGHGEGIVSVSGGTTVTGSGTVFSSIDLTDLIYIPSEKPFPYLITAVTDARTLTISPGSTLTSVGTYWIYEAESTSTVSVDGSPTPTAVMTCTSGCAWNTAGTAGRFVWAARTPANCTAEGEECGSLVMIAGAPSPPYFVKTIDSATQITLNKTINVDLAAVEYAIAPWFDLVRTEIKVSIDELETDAGLAAGSVKTIGAPNNDGSPMLGAYLRRTLGIESVASAIAGNFYNYPGTTDGTFINRQTTDAYWGVKAWKNLLDSVEDSGAWVILNMETVRAADYKTGTASVSASSNTVTGSGTTWSTSLAAVCSPATDCWIFWRDDPDPMSYRIASIDSETQITLDPDDTTVGATLDVDSTPASNQSGVYWIANLAAFDTSCRNIHGGCTHTVAESLEEAFKYYDQQKRGRIAAVTHSDGMRRFRQLSYGYRDLGQNLLPNPRFRVARLDLLPPRTLWTTAVAAQQPIYGWSFVTIVNMNATTTVSVDANGRLGFSNTGAAGPRVQMQTFPSAPYGSEPYVMGIDVESPDTGGTTTRMLLSLGASDQLNFGGGTFGIPQSVTTYPAGSPRAFVYGIVPNANPGIYKARFDCNPEPCANPSAVWASRIQSANASPDPFVMNASSATAGVYTVTYPTAVSTQPLVWVTPLQVNTTCTSGVPLITSAVVTCVNDAGVGVDTDFLFVVYDVGSPRQTLEWKVILDLECLGTTSSNGCRVAAPFLVRGDVYRRD